MYILPTIFAILSVLCFVYGFIFSQDELEANMEILSNTFILDFSAKWKFIGMIGVLFSVAYYFSKSLLCSKTLAWIHVIFFLGLMLVLFFWERDVSNSHNVISAGEFSSRKTMIQFTENYSLKNDTYTNIYLILIFSQLIYFVNLILGVFVKRPENI